MRIRTRLLLLIILATVPLAAVQLYNELGLRVEREREVRRGALATARLLSYDLDRLVGSVRLLLTSLAHSRPRTDDAATCNRYMARLAKAFPLASNIGISDANGQVLCLNTPFQRGRLHNGDRLYFRRAIETRGFAAGEYMVGRATGRRVLAFASPILADDERSIVAVAYASIDLDRLAGELLKRPATPNSSITITDAAGTVLVRLPGREHVGETLPPQWRAMLHAATPGVLENAALFGDAPRTVAYTPPTPPGELMVAIGLDLDASLRAIEDFTERTFMMMALTLLASIALTFLLGRYSIRKPLGRILVAVNRWKGGDFSARTGLRGRRTEFMEIGETFDEMARALGEHERQRDAAERALRQSRDEAMRASASKTQFIASASHDLRQPLQTLSMTVALLAARLGEEDAARIAMLRRAVSSLSDMVEGMMDVAQLDSGLIKPKLTSVDVGGLCDSLKDEFSGPASAQGLELVLSRCAGHVRSDPILLGRVLRNLLSNALKFTPRGGRIEIACDQKADRVDITVRDTGIGIPAERHRQIFEEFQQLNNPERDRRKGLGLGLSIVQRLAELLGHEVSVYSEAGKGAAFTVSAPNAPAPAGPAQAPATAPPPRLEACILLVEDDELVAESTRALLASWGAEVTVARTAGEAFRLLESPDAAFDIAVVDYRLPDQSGFDVLERARRRRQRLGGVLLTGDPSPPLVAAAQAIGIPVVAKPIDAEKLAGLIARLQPGRDSADR